MVEPKTSTSRRKAAATALLVTATMMRIFPRASALNPSSPFVFGSARRRRACSWPRRQVPLGCCGFSAPLPLCSVVGRNRSCHRPAHSLRNAAGPMRMGAARDASSSSTFQPLPPPKAVGVPVFPHVDLANANPESSARRNESPGSVFVVTGASRGIGFQAVTSLLERTKGTVVACCRDPNSPKLLELQSQLAGLRQDHRLVIQKLDLEDQDSVEMAGEQIRGRHDRVDVVIHVAGILGDNGRTHPGPERSVAKLERSWMEKSMAINVIGPMMLNQQLLPLLQRPRASGRRKGASSDDNGDAKQSNELPPPPSIVVHVTARVGSISDNQLGGWYSYRMSKAALNQGTRTLAHELTRHGACCISYHPGTTQTDLSQPFSNNVQQGRLFPVDFSVDRMLAVIDAVTLEHSGGFYDWAGKSIPF